MSASHNKQQITNNKQQNPSTMKQMSFTGIFATSSTNAAKAMASYEARRSAKECAQRAEALMLQAELEPVFRARKRARRLSPTAIVAPEKETLQAMDWNVYKTVGHFLREDRSAKRKAFWESISETIRDAVYRSNVEESTRLADAIWGAVKHQMVSNSYDDNWEFGELRKTLADLASDLKDGANEASPVIRNAYWKVVKTINRMKNPDVRKLLKDLNFSEK